MSSVRLLLAFAETARRRSFAAAARELGLTPSAVAKSVARLEEQLNLRLFHRTTRRVGLTPEGEALFERCQQVLDALDTLEAEASDAARGPVGTLRIDMPVTYGKQVVLPAVARLVERHPGLRADLRLSDQYTDLVGSGLDAVVRIGPVEDSRLVARTIDRQSLVVCASPAYLGRHGRPRHPSELGRHRILAFRLPRTGRLRPWQFHADGHAFEFRPPSDWVVDDGEGLVAGAAAGLGLVQCPDYMAATALAAGTLQPVLEGFEAPPLPISVVYASHRHVPPRLRVFIDELLARGQPATDTNETQGTTPPDGAGAARDDRPVGADRGVGGTSK